MLAHLGVESVVAMGAAQHSFRAGFMFARDYYENLITTGRLRVVEEVVIRFDDDLVPWDNCPQCSKECYDGDNFCRGCGNKIKRP
jgi:hypothetical protein